MSAPHAAPAPISWLAAQKRPFIAANTGALILFVIAALSPIPLHLDISSLSWLLWPGVLYYFTVVFAFLLPLWLVQAVIYAQMWQVGRPHFVSPALSPDLDPRYSCRFLLSLRGTVIVFAVLHLDSMQTAPRWTRPGLLFMLLFAAGLLGLCIGDIVARLMPPLIVLGAIIFWTSALIFGLSHMLEGV